MIDYLYSLRATITGIKHDLTHKAESTSCQCKVETWGECFVDTFIVLQHILNYVIRLVDAVPLRVLIRVLQFDL